MGASIATDHRRLRAGNARHPPSDRAFASITRTSARPRKSARKNSGTSACQNISAISRGKKKKKTVAASSRDLPLTRILPADRLTNPPASGSIDIPASRTWKQARQTGHRLEIGSQKRQRAAQARPIATRIQKVSIRRKTSRSAVAGALEVGLRAAALGSARGMQDTNFQDLRRRRRAGRCGRNGRPWPRLACCSSSSCRCGRRRRRGAIVVVGARQHVMAVRRVAAAVDDFALLSAVCLVRVPAAVRMRQHMSTFTLCHGPFQYDPWHLRLAVGRCVESPRAQVCPRSGLRRIRQCQSAPATSAERSPPLPGRCWSGRSWWRILQRPAARQ